MAGSSVLNGRVEAAGPTRGRRVRPLDDVSSVGDVRRIRRDLRRRRRRCRRCLCRQHRRRVGRRPAGPQVDLGNGGEFFDGAVSELGAGVGWLRGEVFVSF